MTTKAVRKCQPSELVRLSPRALFVVVVDDYHALSCSLGLRAHVQLKLKLQLSCLLLGNNALQTTSTGRSSVYQYNHQIEAPHFTLLPASTSRWPKPSIYQPTCPTIIYARGQMEKTMAEYREFPVLYMVYTESQSFLSNKNAAALKCSGKGGNGQSGNRAHRYSGQVSGQPKGSRSDRPVMSKKLLPSFLSCHLSSSVTSLISPDASQIRNFSASTSGCWSS
jgi:hypothetical protein